LVPTPRRRLRTTSTARPTASRLPAAAPELLGLAADRLERHGDRRGPLDVAFAIATTDDGTPRALGGRCDERAGPDNAGVLQRAAVNQRQASPHTIAAYRDTFRLLLGFAQQRTGVKPHALDIEDLDAVLVSAFLDHLERDRGNGPRTRNARLAAIRSLYHYAALRHPEHAATIARVLAIPTKRHDRAIVSYLDERETTALLAAPDQRRWTGAQPRCRRPAGQQARQDREPQLPDAGHQGKPTWSSEDRLSPGNTRASPSSRSSTITRSSARSGQSATPTTTRWPNASSTPSRPS
jgi:hypothetical protein